MSRDYFVTDSKKCLTIRDLPSEIEPRYQSKKEYKELLAANHRRIADYQTLLYANHASALLVIFQGMDTAGKDGAIKHVMAGVNPQGCSVVSFKAPTADELDHDYLWRVNRALPARGQIGIFNRSYYEEALITRVHPELLKSERLPTGSRHDGKFWKSRYDDIQAYEAYLRRQGFEIVKIFIHISKDEQKRRLQDRFNDPRKLWKISEGDVRERSFWKEYQSAYEECVQHTSSKHSPWYIVPGDNKKSARLCISDILVARFKKLDLEFPKLNSEQLQKIKRLKALLEND